MNKFKLFVLALLIGCNDQEAINNLIYFKDYKTDLCFASWSPRQYQAITNVPCTAQVEKLIVAQERNKGKNND